MVRTWQPPPAAVAETLDGVEAEVPTVTTDTWSPVDVGKLLTVVLGKREHCDAELGAVGSVLSDVMPLAASSSLTRAKYVMSGYPNL